jgi:serine/threonine-protein kinase
VGVVGIQMLTGLAPRRQGGVPTGKLHAFLSALVDEDPERRPASAAAALRALRAIDLPFDGPWPDIADRLPPVRPLGATSGTVLLLLSILCSLVSLALSASALWVLAT